MNAKLVREAFVGVAYLVVIALLITLSVLVYNHAFTNYTTVSLDASGIGNSLQDGSDVQVRGVLVGEVYSITPQGTGAVLRLRLNPSLVDDLPANMTAQLLPKTLFGERYVNLLVPERPSGAMLRSGDVLMEDRSTQTVELEKLFDDMLPVLRAVQPAKLAEMLGAMAQALRGRGADLAATLHTMGSYFGQLAPRLPDLESDFSALAVVARDYTNAAPQLVNGLTDLITTSNTLVSQRQDLENLFSSVTSMSDVVGGFVNTNQNNIIGLSNTSLPSLEILAKYASEFPCIARAIQDYVPVGDRAFGAGSNQTGAHVILHVVNPVVPYTQADRPQFNATGAPRCPYTPPTSLAGTALSAVPGIQGANTASPTGQPAAVTSVPGTSVDAGAGIGPANSPEENELIAELVAPTMGMSPSAFPKWGSLLLGPALRGAEVTMR